VQPREVDFNQLRAGQDGSATLTISGPTGASVAGTLKPLKSWLHLDRTQFSGVSTLVQVTARTSEMPGSGPQSGAIEVTMGNQRMYIPVRVDVRAPPAAAAPKPQPKASQAAPQPFAAGGAWPQAAPAPNVGQNGGRGAARQTAAHAAVPQQPQQPRAATISQVRSLGGLRLALSLLLALLLAFGAPALVNAFALPTLTGLIASPLWVAWALLGIGVIGALIGAPLGYIGAAWPPGRLRTGTLLAGVGALLAISNGVQLQLTRGLTDALPAAPQLGALALTLPLFVGVGAALGVQPLVSRGILAVARYIASRYRLVLLTAAIAGGWIGLTAAQMTLSAVFQQAPVAVSLVSGCGLVLGVALGVMLATPVGYMVRRFAFG
jgi:hypothetical protein